jgi:hypothetical protein
MTNSGLAGGMKLVCILNFYGFFLIAVRERGGVARAIQDWLGLPFDRAYYALVFNWC